MEKCLKTSSSLQCGTTIDCYLIAKNNIKNDSRKRRPFVVNQ